MLFLVKDIVKTNQLLNLVKLQNNDCEMTTGTIYKMKLILMHAFQKQFIGRLLQKVL